jgi:DNA-binding FadR family transcriptional regulator
MERAYRRIMTELLDDVVTGRIPAGGWLPTVEEIAARHACSLGTAREAIRALEERRVVDVRAGRGQQVLGSDRWAVLDRDVAEAALRRGGDPQVLHEALDALRVLEIQAAMEAAPRVSEGDLTLLAEALEQMRAHSGGGNGAGDLGPGFADAEELFHRSLALIAGNRFLAAALESLHPAIAGVRRQRAADRDAAVVRAHERIMAALRERDATAAAAALDAYGRQLASWLRA